MMVIYLFITILVAIFILVFIKLFILETDKKRKQFLLVTWLYSMLILTIVTILMLQYRIDRLESRMTTEFIERVTVEPFEFPDTLERIDQVIEDEEELIICEDIKYESEELVILKYDFTDNDKYLMGRLLCGSKYIDGDGEYDFDYGNEDNLEQISLVLSVVMNRVMDSRFPNTVEEVILQKYPGQGYQFRPVAKWGSTTAELSDIAQRRIEEWCWAYNNDMKGVPSIPENHIYFSSNGKGKNISRP